MCEGICLCGKVCVPSSSHMFKIQSTRLTSQKDISHPSTTHPPHTFSPTPHPKVPCVRNPVPPGEERLRVVPQERHPALRRRRAHHAGEVDMPWPVPPLTWRVLYVNTTAPPLTSHDRRLCAHRRFRTSSWHRPGKIPANFLRRTN